MAKAEKYRIEFKSADGWNCIVKFNFEGFVGTSTTLIGGPRPFVMREFNTDEDIFKPIRPLLAEVEILTNASGVTIEDFYAANDSDISVSFTINSIAYWTGYLLQDDFQETWTDQNHIITVRASEGFGYLKTQQLSNNSDELQGKFTPFELFGYCLEGTSIGGGRFRCFNNLYHDSMNTNALTYGGPLNQCLIDAKSFAIKANEYEDKYTVIEKLNKSWNQTIFVYRNYLVYFRIEELYTPPTENINGFYSNVGIVSGINRRYDIEVGTSSEVKPIAPGMIKLIKKKTKQDEVDVKYDSFDEVVLNESFIRGNLTYTGTDIKEYDLDSWTINTIIGSAGYTKVRETYDATLSGGLIDRYAVLYGADMASISASKVDVTTGQRMNFSVDVQSKYSLTTVTNYIDVLTCWIKIGPTYYYLTEDGSWLTTTGAVTSVKISNLGASNIISTDWNSLEINAVPFPVDGELNIFLNFTQAPHSDHEIRYKNLDIRLTPAFNANSEKREIIGISSKFIKSDDINKSSLNECFLYDGFSDVFKGTLYESDGVTRTDESWGRYRFAGETYSFRRQNTTAYWEHNRVNRTKIDATFYGLFANSEPISLINTVKFVDDDPDKVYAIANLKEIDFSTGIWQATLEEVYDTNRDSLTTQNFAASWTLGTFASPTKIAATLTTSGGFSIQSNTDIRWDGGASITQNITAGISGKLRCSSYPTTINMYMKLNGTAIKTQPYVVNVQDQSFTFNMSPATATTIAPGDIITLEVASATQIQIQSGTITIPSAQSGLTYDPYLDEFIQQ